MPELILKIYELVKAGDLATAKQIQYDVDNIIYAPAPPRAICTPPSREVLRRREGLDLGGVRGASVQPGARGYAPDREVRRHDRRGHGQVDQVIQFRTETKRSYAGEFRNSSFLVGCSDWAGGKIFRRLFGKASSG